MSENVHANGVLAQLRDVDEEDLPDDQTTADGVAMFRGYPVDEIETGEKVMQSPITGDTYRVTMWVEKGADRVIALEKEEVSPDE
jgi:hypothetical protein